MKKEDNIRKYLFISVKPEFANKIVTKEKTIELRKVQPHVNIGDYIIIYASSPVKSVIGYGIIKQVIEKSPRRMWNEHSEFLGIDKERFDEYYADKEKSIGIEIYKIKKIKPISLENLRTIDPNFHPPQVYRYVSNYKINRSIINFIDNNEKTPAQKIT